MVKYPYIINVRVSSEMLKAIQSEADEKGQKISTAARDVLDRGFQAEEAECKKA